MKLIIAELTSSLTQKITVGSDPLDLYAIRPHLYKHQVPTGNLFLEVQDDSGKFIKASETIAISALPNDQAYFHGYVRFQISVPLKAATTYSIALKSSGGYAFLESAYIGWCNDYDLRKVSAGFMPNTGFSAPLDLELWAYKNLRKGALR